MHPRIRGALVLGLACAGVAAPAWAGTTERVSVGAGGVQGNGLSEGNAVSASGRFVVFTSEAANFVPGDTNDIADVLVRDRRTGRIQRVSVGTNGAQGDNLSFGAVLSASGRYVAFTSFASNLAPRDTNNDADVFVHDRKTGRTRRASTGLRGRSADAGSLGAQISGNGRYVAFTSFASNLVSGDTNGTADVFIFDQQTGQLSVGTGGFCEGGAIGGAMSADGRLVAFSSGCDLVPGITTSGAQVFVRDRRTGESRLVSVGPGGVQGDGFNAPVAVSANGRFVSFVSRSTNLVAGDTNNDADVFVHDLQTGQTERVSVASDGTQGNGFSSGGEMSADGRFVAFTSDATNLVPGDTNGQSDIFVHDRQTGQTERVSVATDGTQGNGQSRFQGLTADGGMVVFASDASNLVPNDTNSVIDTFVHTR